MVRRLGFAGALILLGVYACKADDPHPAAAGDPSQAGPISRSGGGGGVAQDNGTSGTVGDDDGGFIDGSIDGATGTTCTSLALTGVVVDEVADAQDPPAATGGTINNGTYNLTQVDKYLGATGSLAGPTGTTYQSTIRITNGTTFERVVVIASNATAGTEEGSVGVMLITAPNIAITINCPLQQQEQYTYTATSTTIVMTNTVTRESYTYLISNL